MQFRKFAGTDSACDNIYDDPDYEGTFFVENSEGERFKVALTWEQGRANNYRFIRGGDTIGYTSEDVIWPRQVKQIEIKGNK